MLPGARDIFQFVDFQHVYRGPHADADLACEAMQEVPQQYREAKACGAFAMCSADDPELEKMYVAYYGEPSSASRVTLGN